MSYRNEEKAMAEESGDLYQRLLVSNGVEVAVTVDEDGVLRTVDVWWGNDGPPWSNHMGADLEDMPTTEEARQQRRVLVDARWNGG